MRNIGWLLLAPFPRLLPMPPGKLPHLAGTRRTAPRVPTRRKSFYRRISKVENRMQPCQSL